MTGARFQPLLRKHRAAGHIDRIRSQETLEIRDKRDRVFVSFVFMIVCEKKTCKLQKVMVCLVYVCGLVCVHVGGVFLVCVCVCVRESSTCGVGFVCGVMS